MVRVLNAICAFDTRTIGARSACRVDVSSPELFRGVRRVLLGGAGEDAAGPRRATTTAPDAAHI